MIFEEKRLASMVFLLLAYNVKSNKAQRRLKIRALKKFYRVYITKGFKAL